MVIGPVYSERRSCSAVRAAASPPPTMTTPPLVVTWSSYTIGAAISTPPCGCSTSRPPLDDVRQHHDAFTALDVGAGTDAFQRLLEMPHIAGKHMQHGVRRTRHRRGADHLGDVHPRRPQLGGGDGALAEHLHVGLSGPAERIAVDDGG